MAIIKNKTKQMENEECQQTGILVLSWWESKIECLLWKTLWWFLKKLKAKIPIVPLLDTYTTELKVVTQILVH